MVVWTLPPSACRPSRTLKVFQFCACNILPTSCLLGWWMAMWWCITGGVKVRLLNGNLRSLKTWWCCWIICRGLLVNIPRGVNTELFSLNEKLPLCHIINILSKMCDVINNMFYSVLFYCPSVMTTLIIQLLQIKSQTSVWNIASGILLYTVSFSSFVSELCKRLHCCWLCLQMAFGTRPPAGRWQLARLPWRPCWEWRPPSGPAVPTKSRWSRAPPFTRKYVGPAMLHSSVERDNTVLAKYANRGKTKTNKQTKKQGWAYEVSQWELPNPINW